MKTSAIKRLQRASIENRKSSGSYFAEGDEKAETLTVNDIRLISRICMDKLIDACIKGTLIDIKSIVREYWENELDRCTPDELLAHVKSYGDDLENVRFSKSEIEKGLIKLSHRDKANSK